MTCSPAPTPRPTGEGLWLVLNAGTRSLMTSSAAAPLGADELPSPARSACSSHPAPPPPLGWRMLHAHLTGRTPMFYIVDG